MAKRRAMTIKERVDALEAKIFGDKKPKSVKEEMAEVPMEYPIGEEPVEEPVEKKR